MTTEWEIGATTDSDQAIVTNGNKLMMGNGYLGYRGTLDEFTAADFVAVNLLGLYDQQGMAWRESINAPNPLFLQVQAEGTPLSVKTTPLLAHRQWLNLKTASHHRRTVFALPRQGSLTLTTTRFASGAVDHILAQQVTITVDRPVKLTVTSLIDQQVWDINGPHFQVEQQQADAAAQAVLARTGEGAQLIVATTMTTDFPQAGSALTTIQGVGRQWSFTAQPGQVYSLTKIATVYTSNDVPASTLGQAARQSLSEQGDYAEVWRRHCQAWQTRWDHSDVQIQGDEAAQQALRYSLYQLQIIAPHHLDMSIPARGLSGQTYKGAIFWDTEMFMLPFFIRNDPEVARRLLNYRVRTLPAAQEKAKEYGFQGAFYAWESQEQGQDATSDYNVTDVFTGRPMRTFFRDKQIHISADIAYALWTAYQFTQDLRLLEDGGAEVLVECAKFYYSYAYWSPLKQRYELLDVLGPDEYHERVNNNAFTNKMAQFTAQAAAAAMAELARQAPTTFATVATKVDWGQWQDRLSDFCQHLYLPLPATKTGLIPQFDGYFAKEDATVAAVRERLLQPNEYWGGAYGVATETQVIKQADLIFMLLLFADEYPTKIKEQNWAYYEPRTEHGSSLSASVYAQLACQIGRSDWAYPFFMKSATVDLTGDSKTFAGGIYIGGTHPAANGGAWLAVVQGFCGLEQHGDQLNVHPRLPRNWTKVRFKVCFRSEWYQAVVTQDHATIKKIKK